MTVTQRRTKAVEAINQAFVLAGEQAADLPCYGIWDTWDDGGIWEKKWEMMGDRSANGFNGRIRGDALTSDAWCIGTQKEEICINWTDQL